jgi:hypothetical protein
LKDHHHLLASVTLQDDDAKQENKKMANKQRLCLSHDIASQDEEPPARQTPMKPPFSMTDAKKSHEPSRSQLELFPPVGVTRYFSRKQPQPNIFVFHNTRITSWGPICVLLKWTVHL